MQRLANTSIKNEEHGLNVIATVLLGIPQWENTPEKFVHINVTKTIKAMLDSIAAAQNILPSSSAQLIV